MMTSQNPSSRFRLRAVSARFTPFGCGRRLMLLLLAVGLATGCGETADDDAATDDAATQSAGEAAGEATDDSCGGWWCVGHGIPEDECSMCSSKVAAEFKEDGDWCDEHDRAESQCFICNPQLEAKFAARYEAKTGNKPPKPKS